MQKITRLLVRETAAADRLWWNHPEFVVFRLKGTLRQYSADWQNAVPVCSKPEAKRIVAERKALKRNSLRRSITPSGLRSRMLSGDPAVNPNQPAPISATRLF
jgi:hypothetical protein